MLISLCLGNFSFYDGQCTETVESFVKYSVSMAVWVVFMLNLSSCHLLLAGLNGLNAMLPAPYHRLREEVTRNAFSSWLGVTTWIMLICEFFYLHDITDISSYTWHTAAIAWFYISVVPLCLLYLAIVYLILSKFRFRSRQITDCEDKTDFWYLINSDKVAVLAMVFLPLATLTFFWGVHVYANVGIHFAEQVLLNYKKVLFAWKYVTNNKFSISDEIETSSLNQMFNLNLNETIRFQNLLYIASIWELL